MPKLFCLLTIFFISALSYGNEKKDPLSYDVLYEVSLLPRKGYAKVTITIPNASLLSTLSFSIDPKIHKRVKANGELTLSKTSAIWSPPKQKAQLTFQSKINHKRAGGKYDALMKRDWSIFRGDDLIPPAKVRSKQGAYSKSYLSFILPDGWNTVETGWERDRSAPVTGQQKNPPHFFIDNPERRFDRPTGWMIAGKVGTRRAKFDDTTVSVSAPEKSTFHRMDVLTFINFLWPEIINAFKTAPPKLLVVGAGDPMWRGGLSASNSLFLHADRPLVSENGTSTLVHEIVHMVTRVRGENLDDWIAEGLAEYYAIELLYRSGGITETRRDIVKQKLSTWSKDVKKIRVERSSGAITAKATLLFYRLDEEIRKKSKGKSNLDHLVRELMLQRKISYTMLKNICYKIVNSQCNSLNDI